MIHLALLKSPWSNSSSVTLQKPQLWYTQKQSLARPDQDLYIHGTAVFFWPSEAFAAKPAWISKASCAHKAGSTAICSEWCLLPPGYTLQRGHHLGWSDHICSWGHLWAVSEPQVSVQTAWYNERVVLQPAKSLFPYYDDENVFHVPQGHLDSLGRLAWVGKSKLFIIFHWKFLAAFYVYKEKAVLILKNGPEKVQAHNLLVGATAKTGMQYEC